MASKWKVGVLTAALVMFTLTSVYAGPKDGDGDHDGHHRIRHVLLISIDGMHAVDYANCVTANTCPHMAELGETGVTYTRTTTSRPSDSFPGLMALVTGGTPRTVGAYYDVAYDRVLAAPKVHTGNGLPGEDQGNQYQCKQGQINGTQTEYEEGDEYNQTLLNGGNPVAASVIDGSYQAIDPDHLIRDPFNGCNPVYPWNFVRTNTIYGVIHKAGGYTAWSDKHAVYAVVSGPTGTNFPSNVDDYYSPEVNSNQISLPGIKTAALPGVSSFDCSTIAPSGNDWTTDFGYGTSLTALFNPPGVPDTPGPCCKLREGGDPRTPDIVVLPNVGVVYTGGDKKQSEHGGYAWDDTNVMMLVSNPKFERKILHSFVETTQVAPTILQFLGLDPDELDAVRKEGTPVLPGLDFGDDH